MKRLFFIFALVIAFLIGMVVAVQVNAAQERPLKIWYENSNGMMETYCIVDANTGVNYVVVSGELHGDPIGAAIYPRLNPDGSLYITP